MRKIFEFRFSHTAVELSLDEGGTDVYFVHTVSSYDGEIGDPVRIEECRIADKSLAVHAFEHHCRRHVEDWTHMGMPVVERLMRIWNILANGEENR